MKTNFTSAFALTFKKNAFLFLLLGLFLIANNGNAQQVKGSIDSTHIKIGERITYTLQVETTDSTNLVVFPEGQTFKPLEVFDTTAVDTSFQKEKYKMVREYALTQFDSGKYTIPRQKIMINDQQFFTDSLLVEVGDVSVDTTKQKMFPIKPSVDIKKHFQVPNWLWWTLGILAILGGIAFLFFRRKQKAAAEAKLPPYEQAMFTLQNLDSSDTLERGEMKEYYSALSLAVKRYLDEKVDERALESTTEELITRLQMLKNAQKLYLKEHVIQSLEAILKRADLAKFAGLNTDRITAKADRKTIEEDINEFKNAIPEPTEEELLRDEKYRLQRERKAKKRKVIFGISAGVAVVVIALTVFVGVKGFGYVKDLAFASASKELLRGDWIQSEYGDPGITVTTPKVLIRTDEPLEPGQPVKAIQSFAYGKPTENFFVYAATMQYAKDKQADLEKSVEGVMKEIEHYGGQNITNKKEEFATPNGAKGIKVFGRFTLKNPVTNNKVKKAYSVVNFGQQQGFQQILVIYDDGDADAKEIAGRINSSIEFNTGQK